MIHNKCSVDQVHFKKISEYTGVFSVHEVEFAKKKKKKQKKTILLNSSTLSPSLFFLANPEFFLQKICRRFSLIIYSLCINPNFEISTSHLSRVFSDVSKA